MLIAKVVGCCSLLKERNARSREAKLALFHNLSDCKSKKFTAEEVVSELDLHGDRVARLDAWLQDEAKLKAFETTAQVRAFLNSLSGFSCESGQHPIACNFFRTTAPGQPQNPIKPRFSRMKNLLKCFDGILALCPTLSAPAKQRLCSGFSRSSDLWKGLKTESDPKPYLPKVIQELDLRDDRVARMDAWLKHSPQGATLAFKTSSEVKMHQAYRGCVDHVSIFPHDCRRFGPISDERPLYRSWRGSMRLQTEESLSILKVTKARVCLATIRSSGHSSIAIPAAIPPCPQRLKRSRTTSPSSTPSYERRRFRSPFKQR